MACHCSSRGWIPTVRLTDGARVAIRCDCPAGVALAELPELEQLGEDERSLLVAVGRSIARRRPRPTWPTRTRLGTIPRWTSRRN